MVSSEDYKRSERIWGNLITCIWYLTFSVVICLKEIIALLKSILILLYRVRIKKTDSTYADIEGKTKLIAR